MEFITSLDTRIWAAAFFAVLFLQSGIDKVVDRKGNLSWMVPHFEKSPFKGTVPVMLSVLTVFELATGVLSALAVVACFTNPGSPWPKLAMFAVCATLVMLFAGQRLAKDYAGAASLAAYFAAALVGLAIASPR